MEWCTKILFDVVYCSTRIYYVNNLFDVVYCSTRIYYVNKRPTDASIVIQYNSIFFYSYMFLHLKCHLQGVYWEPSEIYAWLLLKSTQWMVDICYVWCRDIQRTIEWSCPACTEGYIQVVVVPPWVGTVEQQPPEYNPLYTLGNFTQ
jgi:hypothetical protein